MLYFYWEQYRRAQLRPTPFSALYIMLKALADIRSVSPLVKAEEFKTRAQIYRKKHPDWPLTPSALAKWWGDCHPLNPVSQFTTIH